MDTMQLRYYVSVAEQLSFTAAAAHFGISQPTICRQISALEEELGVRLLVRSTHGVSLTTAGMECLDYARRLLDLENRALSRVSNISDGHFGTLRVAALYSSAKDLGDCLSVFALRYPEIQVDIDLISRIYTADSEEMANYDFFFTQDSILSGQSDLDYFYSHREQLHLVMHKRDKVLVRGQDFSPLANRPFLTIDSSHEPFFLDQIISICRARNFVPKMAGHHNHFHAALIAVNAGMGITILPRSFLGNTRLENLAAIPIEGDDASISSVVAWRKNTENLAVHHFSEVVRELYQHKNENSPA